MFQKAGVKFGRGSGENEVRSRLGNIEVDDKSWLDKVRINVD